MSNDMLPTAKPSQLDIPAITPGLDPAMVVAIMIATMCAKQSGEWGGVTRMALKVLAQSHPMAINADTVDRGIEMLRGQSCIAIARASKDAENDVIFPIQGLVHKLYEVPQAA